MAKTGLLVVTNPTKVSRILPLVQNHVQNTLYIQISPDNRLTPPWTGHSESVSNPLYGQTVIGIYSQSSVACKNIDVRILLSGIKDPFLSIINTRREIEVVFFDKYFSKDETNNFIKSCLSNATPTCQTMTLGTSNSTEDPASMPECTSNLLNNASPKSSTDINNCDYKMYNNVVLGGTFDRLHAGHKILLSESLLRCSKKLTVGVTDTPMLKSKKLWELIEPCSKRISNLQDFLKDVDPSVQYEIVPIVDPFGPTQEDPSLELIVVSSETYKGGLKVNEVRSQKDFPVLDMYCVKLLEGSTQSGVEELKVSSSNHRIRLLGTKLRTPEPKSNIPARPYIIGLTGIMASGKSSVGRKLANLGAGLIDCDALAHVLYRKGEDCYHRLVEQFGEGILDSEGEVNRRTLGAIVFNNKEQLAKLTALLWPAILERAQQEGLRLYQEGHQVVVMDAAVLLQAGWDDYCHEVWSCILPPEEAVKRIQVRNKLSIAEAEVRLSQQPTNSEMVAKAHVVFCTLWEPEFTQTQVEKAWTELQTYLTQQAKL